MTAERISERTARDTAHTASAQDDEPEPEVPRRLLAALVEMALRSKRHQADLDACVGRAGLAAPREVLLRAMERLRRDGCVETVVELRDGGILLTVTARGLEWLAAMQRAGAPVAGHPPPAGSASDAGEEFPPARDHGGLGEGCLEALPSGGGQRRGQGGIVE